MTQDEIIEIAREVYGTQATEQEIRFAKLVAAKEREACAKLCDELAFDWYERHHPLECARKIRARSKA